MIRLNVFIQVSESNRAALLKAAKELVASSLKDGGCIAYDVIKLPQNALIRTDKILNI